MVGARRVRDVADALAVAERIGLGRRGLVGVAAAARREEQGWDYDPSDAEGLLRREALCQSIAPCRRLRGVAGHVGRAAGFGEELLEARLDLVLLRVDRLDADVHLGRDLVGRHALAEVERR